MFLCERDTTVPAPGAEGTPTLRAQGGQCGAFDSTGNVNDFAAADGETDMAVFLAVRRIGVEVDSCTCRDIGFVGTDSPCITGLSSGPFGIASSDGFGGRIGDESLAISHVAFFPCIASDIILGEIDSWFGLGRNRGRTAT